MSGHHAKQPKFFGDGVIGVMKLEHITGGMSSKKKPPPPAQAQKSNSATPTTPAHSAEK